MSGPVAVEESDYSWQSRCEMTDAGRVADLLAEIFRDGPAEVAFDRACQACVEVLPVSGAAISVMSDVPSATAWQTLGASDDTAAGMEELQFTLGAGPCREAHTIGGPVLIADLTAPAAAAAWPVFASRAEEFGVRAVFAFPLHLGVIRPGVLGLYRDRPGSLPESAMSDALLAADVLCLALLGRLDGWRTGNGRASGGADGQAVANMWADHAALGRAEVHQATGMVMALLGVSSEEALARLRGYAFAHDLLLTEVAAGVVARHIVLDQDGAAGAR